MSLECGLAERRADLFGRHRFSIVTEMYYASFCLLVLDQQVEDQLNIRLLMAPIDECLMSERCESNGCSSALITGSQPLLINTNGTSIVGLMAYVQVQCTCTARSFHDNDVIECRQDTCMNGGTCLQLSRSAVE